VYQIDDCYTSCLLLVPVKVSRVFYFLGRRGFAYVREGFWRRRLMYGKGLSSLSCWPSSGTLSTRSIILIARTSIIGKSISVTRRRAGLFNLVECKLVGCSSEVLLAAFCTRSPLYSSLSSAQLQQFCLLSRY